MLTSVHINPLVYEDMSSYTTTSISNGVIGIPVGQYRVVTQPPTGLGISLTPGFYIKSVDGLDPVKADIFTSRFAISDGDLYSSHRVGPRTVILKIGLVPDYVGTTYESLRNQLITLMPPGAAVGLRLMVDSKVFGDLSGFVEDVEANAFSADPEVFITILCPNPDIVSPETKSYSGITNKSSSLGETSASHVINYGGTRPAPFYFRSTFTAADTLFKTTYLSNVSRKTVLMSANDTFNVNDKVFMNTEMTKRALTRNGLSLLRRLSVDSQWPMLSPGQNTFTFAGGGGLVGYTPGTSFWVKWRERYASI